MADIHPRGIKYLRHTEDKLQHSTVAMGYTAHLLKS